MHKLVIGASCAALLFADVGSAQTALERAERDEIVMVDYDDPDMTAAFAKARKGRAEFLRLARKPRPSIAHMSVKIGIRDKAGYEYFWVGPFTRRDRNFIGLIDNVPRIVGNVRKGEIIRFREADIVDWFYIEHGRMVGNFTVCALLKKDTPASREEFQKEFGLTCED